MLFVATLLITFSFLVIWSSDTTGAQSNNIPSGGNVNSQNPDPGLPINTDRSAIVDCNGDTASGAKRCLEKNPLVQRTLQGINFLSAGAGVVITASIVIAGIQYAAAGPNPQQVAAARKRIISSIVALLALLFLYAFLQWLVPGGVI